MSSESTAPIIGINRHRINCDGKGIRTLVGFGGCPLSCKYCLNENCHNEPQRFMTPKEIVETIGVDTLYYRFSDGGVTFGGGEPLLYPDFIKEVVALSSQYCNFTVETSLNVPHDNVVKCIDFIDNFICDLKIYSTEKYLSYTGVSNADVLYNLTWLSENIDKKRIVVRLPHISGFTDKTDIEKAKKFLNSLGISQVDQFEYLMPEDFSDSQKSVLSRGKSICNYLKSIRQKIASQNGLQFTSEECNYTGPCMGTCPKCDAELDALTSYIRILDKYKINIVL